MDHNNYENCISFVPSPFNIVSLEKEDQIVELLASAQKKKQKVYVHSTGNNWGYGAKAPQEGDSVVISLKKMNQILSFDPELGIVQIEPGVTYQQLSQFLISKGDQWLCPVHGGGPSCSVLGNVLERGFGITPIEDHFASLMNLRVILPDGSVYESSFSSLKLPQPTANFQWGVGPYMDGLFTQSNLGIVTRMSIKLAPKKEEIAVFMVSVKPETPLNQIIDCISSLQKKYTGVIGGVNLMNKERMLSMSAAYPEKKRLNGEPLSKDDIRKLTKALPLEDWSIAFSLHGERQVVRLVTKLCKRKLRPLSKSVQLITPFKLKVLKVLSALLPSKIKAILSRPIDMISGLFGILNGRPNYAALNLAYWMNEAKPKDPLNLAPDQDGCGIIWYSPIIPLKSDAVEKFLEQTEALCKTHGFNHLITLSCFNHLSFECTFPILYNKNLPGSGEKAKEFYLALLRKNKEIGCFPYRLPLFAMDDLKSSLDPKASSLAYKIKRATDPNEILAPNRYIFSSSSNIPLDK